MPSNQKSLHESIKIQDIQEKSATLCVTIDCPLSPRSLAGFIFVQNKSMRIQIMMIISLKISPKLKKLPLFLKTKRSILKQENYHKNIHLKLLV